MDFAWSIKIFEQNFIFLPKFELSSKISKSSISGKFPNKIKNKNYVITKHISYFSILFNKFTILRSTSPTPGTSPPRGPRHLSGKMSPAPLLPREHLTITPRKGPVTKEGILLWELFFYHHHFYPPFMWHQDSSQNTGGMVVRKHKIRDKILRDCKELQNCACKELDKKKIGTKNYVPVRNYTRKL